MESTAFNPSGIGLKNGNFIGLPFDYESSKVVLHSVPWDVTVSFGDGTSTGPENILEASYQLDLEDCNVEKAWQKSAIYWKPVDVETVQKSTAFRKKAKIMIDFLENGGIVKNNPIMENFAQSIENANKETIDNTYLTTKKLLKDGKIAGLIGGDHSTPYGQIKALAEVNSFGILQIDAHMDLRNSYEGFEYSHASIFYNVMKLENVEKLVQVGIRDYCKEELDYVASQKDRIEVFYDHEIQRKLLDGTPFSQLAKEMINALPQKVYLSVDIDGLIPELCPNTGTPVPGGLSFQQFDYLIFLLIQSGKKIVGFDLCEVAGIGNDWDGNVGARVLYKLCNAAAQSHIN